MRCERGGPDVEDGLADESAGVLVGCSYGRFDLFREMSIRTAGQERERSGTHAVDLDVLFQRTRACRVEIARHESAALLPRRNRKIPKPAKASTTTSCGENDSMRRPCSVWRREFQ